MTRKPSRNTLHKRAERARKRAQGLKRIELWIDPRIERTLRAFIRSAFGDKPMPARVHVGERITLENAAEFARDFVSGADAVSSVQHTRGDNDDFTYDD